LSVSIPMALQPAAQPSVPGSPWNDLRKLFLFNADSFRALHHNG